MYYHLLVFRLSIHACCENISQLFNTRPCGPCLTVDDVGCPTEVDPCTQSMSRVASRPDVIMIRARLLLHRQSHLVSSLRVKNVLPVRYSFLLILPGSRSVSSILLSCLLLPICYRLTLVTSDDAHGYSSSAHTTVLQCPVIARRSSIYVHSRPSGSTTSPLSLSVSM